MPEDVVILGEFTDEGKGARPVSQTSLVADAADMLQNWRRVSLSSDFLAKYYSYYFPYKEKAKDRISRDSAENTISFVMNELIENTAKYTDGRDKTVTIKIMLYEHHVVFQVANFLTPALADSFSKLAREILESNAEELYIKRLERNTESDSGDSGLGYLTLINDYGIRMGFRFQKIDADMVQVTIQARMKSREER
jgi:hypothetical protein